MITLVEDDVHVVETRAQLVAAMLAAARPTHGEARLSPFTILLGTAKYSFPGGLHTVRAEYIAKNAGRYPVGAFKVAA